MLRKRAARTLSMTHLFKRLETKTDCGQRISREELTA